MLYFSSAKLYFCWGTIRKQKKRKEKMRCQCPEIATTVVNASFETAETSSQFQIRPSWKTDVSFVKLQSIEKPTFIFLSSIDISSQTYPFPIQWFTKPKCNVTRIPTPLHQQGAKNTRTHYYHWCGTQVGTIAKFYILGRGGNGNDTNQTDKCAGMVVVFPICFFSPWSFQTNHESPSFKIQYEFVCCPKQLLKLI